MKRVIVWTSAVALLVSALTLTGNAWSQSGKEPSGAAASAPHKVGLIDMAHVFKNYKKFETLREELKDKIAASEEQAKEMQKGLADKQKSMKGLVEGSPEFAKAEKDVVKMAADFETFRRAASREFLKEESQIYLQVYNETSDMVTKYAKAFNYTLVIRFNREELDTENPQNLLQGMNRQVVYHRAEDDITLQILDALNRKYAPNTTPAPAGGAAPRNASKKTTAPN